jgi:alpha-amylase
VTISGAVSKTYSLADFKNKSLSISVESLGLTADKTITVSASATNSEGTTSAGPVTLKTIDAPAPSKDTFTWDNVNAYFVLTDRFANGNSANDHSYSRKNGLSGDENVATFHGGDIKGLTDNMDYFKKLGINAIWITAPYEQAHGWVGGKNGKFPHYAFHGYYTLDWTFMDQNMGTIDEFRAFVQACHENGIRVIMDVVMNHVGYNNTQDMITYGHGKTSHGDGWLEKVGGKWEANDTVVWDHNLWETWWGPWARSFAYEKTGSEYGGSCGGLPDVRSEVADTNIGVAPVLKIKWEKEDNTAYDKWRVPAVANVDWWNKSGNWRQNQTARIVEYQCVWLSAWVREFGIDGFRCDTAKHVEPQYWGMLKDACTDALKKWRADSSKVDNSGAKNWDEAFWMTGECWGWTSTGGGGEYYQTGKFDSMINFSFNGGNSWDGNYRQGYPKPNNWDSYININKNGDSDGNGHRDNVLSYISSHDTALTRVGDQYEVGTGLVLLPGGVQIYYGDESYREKAYTGCGDGDMMTRGDMNLSEAKSSALTAHWGKVGNFRKYNPAVGAGTGSGTKRTYNDSKVAIGISGSSVDVSGLFTDGETVYNWYDGKSAVVSGGKVTFDGGSMKQPILVSDRNPADYEVTF